MSGGSKIPARNRYLYGGGCDGQRFELQAARWVCHTQNVIAPIKRAAWIHSLTGLPFSTIAGPIMAAAHASAQSTSFVDDGLEDVIMV